MITIFYRRKQKLGQNILAGHFSQKNLENFMNSVTVIITTFNNSKKAELSLNSVLSQEAPVSQIIIVDDCSNKSHVLYLESMFKDTNILFLKTNINSGGPSQPRNLGLAYAKGEYVTFLDAGDLWLPNHVNNYKNFMNANYPIIFSDYYISNYRAKVIKKSPDHVGYNKNKLRCYLGMTTVFLKRVIAQNFDDVQTHEDYLLWLKLIKNMPAVNNRMGPSSIHYRDKNSRSSFIIRNIKGVYKVYKLAGYKYPVYRTALYVILTGIERILIKIKLGF